MSLKWSNGQKKKELKIVNFFLTGTLVTYLPLWRYITVALVHFMMLPKMYLVINLIINNKSTPFSKAFSRILQDQDMLYNAPYLIFRQIFKLLAHAFILIHIWLKFTLIFGRLALILEQKALATIVDWCHIIVQGEKTDCLLAPISAKGDKYERMNQKLRMCTTSDDSFLLKVLKNWWHASCHSLP